MKHLKDSTNHPLRDLTIHECILDAAEQVLSNAASGLELPGFTTCVESEDEDGRSTIIKVSYGTSYSGEALCAEEHEFLLDENVLKGIAKGRNQDIAAFMAAFLPTYRALIIGCYFDYLIGISIHRIGTDDDSINHERFADDVKWFKCYSGPWTAPWELVEASAESVSEDWFELLLSFENPQIPERYSAVGDQGAAYDGRLVSIPISWEEYLDASGSEKGMHTLLRRIQGAFVVLGDRAPGYYTSFAKDVLERLDNDDEEDCPFTSGELVVTSNGRVHFSSDLD